MKVTSITTKNGDQIELSKFTLLVGPNNVGKSQTLKDVYRKLTKGHGSDTVLINAVEVERPETFDQLLEGLDVRVDHQNIGLHTIDGVTTGSDPNSLIRIQIEFERKRYQTDKSLDGTFLNLSKFRTFYLDSESRLNIASKTPNFIPDVSSPKNFLQALYGSFGAFDASLKDAFKTTFDMDVSLDYSSGLELRLAVSKQFGEIPEDPRKAYPLMRNYPSIEQQGDGFRSFVAVVLTLLLSKDKVVLLDEPEAFLHPEQARRLGKWISDHTESFPCQIIISTHNASFLAGLLAGRQPADIYRLNRIDELTTFTRITSEATRKLSSSPLLSSQRVLEAIFARGVVVCESDTDRILYNTVAVREHDNQEILFVHAHNKQTIKDVAALLAEASIPIVGVADIDLLNSNKDFSDAIGAFVDVSNCRDIISIRDEIAQHVESRSEADLLLEIKDNIQELLGQLDAGEHSLSGARSALERIKSDSGRWAPIKKRGLEALDEPFKSKAFDVIEFCCRHGLFLVPVGELESWMELGVKKNRWIVPALEALNRGECPQSLSDFVGRMQEFIFEYGANKRFQATQDSGEAAVLGA